MPPGVVEAAPWPLAAVDGKRPAHAIVLAASCSWTLEVERALHALAVTANAAANTPSSPVTLVDSDEPLVVGRSTTDESQSSALPCDDDDDCGEGGDATAACCDVAACCDDASRHDARADDPLAAARARAAQLDRACKTSEPLAACDETPRGEAHFESHDQCWAHLLESLSEQLGLLSRARSIRVSFSHARQALSCPL